MNALQSQIQAKTAAICYPLQMSEPGQSVNLSIIAPAHNEEDNVLPLIEEIEKAVGNLDMSYEILLVDDGSTDSTRTKIKNAMNDHANLRLICMESTPPGKGNGQSAAFHAGFRASCGELIALLDADLQNDPADIPAMIELLHKEGADFVQGDRSHARRDNLVRRVTSIIGRLTRRWLLADSIRDTGCSLRVLKREVALQLPLQFRGLHRFIPVTARQLGYKVIETQVNHRPRTQGEAKYGIWNRAIPGFIDCLGVRWMRNRRRPVDFSEIKQAGASDPGSGGGKDK